MIDLNDLKLTIVIPARYESTRFPKKLIHKIGTKPMIEYVYNACSNLHKNIQVIIATDHQIIYDVCSSFIKNSDRIVMTPDNLASGSDRVAYVVKDINTDFVINMQADEPLITPDVINSLIVELITCDNNAPVATLFKKELIKNNPDFVNKNVVKVVKSFDNCALYFSRSSVPGSKENMEPEYFYKHIGIYGYLKSFLLNYSKLKSGFLEQTESLEQLRILEHGYKIRLAETSADLIGVDIIESIPIVKNILKQRGSLL